MSAEEMQGEMKDTKPVFKMPVLIGKRPGLAKVIKSVKPVLSEASTPSSVNLEPAVEISEESQVKLNEKLEKEEILYGASSITPERKTKPDISALIPYHEPTWGGIPNNPYSLEVLKQGIIVERIDLSQKSFHVLGRLETCDIPMQHPSTSRYHCIIQHRSVADEENDVGMYLYDLGSTHGTFVNNFRLIPKAYQPLKVGHVFKVGGSKRIFILNGPQDDEEPESELSVTELKQLKAQKEEERRKAEELAKLELEHLKAVEEKETEEKGISWGLPEDADVETDLTENPYAVNVELELDDPKKTLRGWFEREGYEFEYDVSEKTPGHFVCRVELPVDNNEGRAIVAEASSKGKKKDVVVQCALEACKILDNLGLLRQAKHETRAKRERFHDEDDYYSSDEDTFLDRTGELEKKRKKRMEAAGKLEEKAETHESLVAKHNAVVAELNSISKQLETAAASAAERKRLEEENVDSLDAFMTSLKSTEVADKATVGKLKIKRSTLQKEETRLKKLVDLTRPLQLKL